jgi:hypothetical protein
MKIARHEVTMAAATRAGFFCCRLAVMPIALEQARWTRCSTHVYIDTKFPGEPAGIKDEYFKCIAADVFLG